MSDQRVVLEWYLMLFMLCDIVNDTVPVLQYAVVVEDSVNVIGVNVMDIDIAVNLSLIHI